MIHSSIKHYSIYNYSLLISRNQINYMLNSTFKLQSSKNSSQHNQSFIDMSSIYSRLYLQNYSER